MELYQARGYYLEEIVRALMRKSKFVEIQTGKIEGRGADHQIDSYGTFKFTIPFVYPVRLISEVKWFSRKYKAQLSHLRNFFGVLIDISQNYFVPRSMRSGTQPTNMSLPKERYTDCGAFFSATGFTEDAQHFAWAHGIYLIPFSEDEILRPILTQANNLLRQNPGWRSAGSTKSRVIEMARTHFQSDSVLRGLMSGISAYVGILDGLYPVFLVSRGEFDFSPEASDNLEEGMSFEHNIATKERRIEREGDVNFQFTFQNARFSFSLPVTIAAKIIQAIESTYGGEAFGTLDIPVVLKVETGTYRRIFRIRLALPDKSGLIRALE